MKSLLTIGSICAVLALAFGVAPHAARAATITAVFTGTIDNGDDTGNFFGGSLNHGDAFTLTSVFDTALGSYSNVGHGAVFGGGTAKLNVNGHNVTFFISPSSYKFDSFGNLKVFLGQTSNTFISAAFFSAGLPGSILTSFSKDCFNDQSCGGSFEIASGGFSGGSFNTSHLTVSVAGTVAPIPATLPLFASALLGLGVVTRRRRAAQ